MSTPTAVTVSAVRESVVVTNNGDVTTVVTPPSTTRVTISTVGPQGPAGTAGPGVAAGGATGDLLVKTSATDYATAWTDAPTVDTLGFDLTAAEAVNAGQLSWDIDDQTLHLGLPGGVTAHLGSETLILCRNNSNTVAIPKGTAVRFAGSIGNSGRLKVAPMVADGTYPGYVFFGVTDQAIAGGADGYVTAFGKIRGINTSAYQDGDILWCSPTTPGAFTATEPAAPNLKLPVAAVVHASNNGTIFVRWTAGFRLKDLHDVEAPAPTNGQVLAYNTAAGRWETQEPGAFPVDTLSLDTTAAASVTTGQVAWNAAEGTLDVGLLHGSVNQLGQEVQLLCTNSAASLTITNGMGVMFTGGNSSTLRLEVQPMQANGSLPGYVFFGIATQTIVPGATGYITTFGKVRGLNTSAYPEDSILWCDPVNPGQFVLAEPVAPNLKIAAAAVIKSHATEGVLMVRAETGQNLSDCHDVEVDSAQDTDYLGWSEAMQHWMPLSVPNAAPRSITIAGPQIGDSFTLFRTSGSTTIASAVALVSGGSVTYELRYAADRTTAGTLATVSDTVTNTTTGDSATVQNQPIPSGRYVWLNITAVTGTVNEFNLSVAF